uniref:Uncharacterized protein n=1 Tax=Castor canadensis TaxID=51338 RepID=A0A8C0ZWT5_CASCN
MVDAAMDRNECGKQQPVSLPVSCICIIMKSSPEVSSINQRVWCSPPRPGSSLFNS